MLIGLTGRKQAGKDTVANYLDAYGFKRIGFADQLKQAATALLDMPIQRIDEFKVDGELTIRRPGTEPYMMSGREFLQRFGTEMGRETFGEDFWVERWFDAYEATDEHVVVNDVRFDNEARKIISEGGYLIEIIRPGYDSDGHASEAGINEDLIDFVIGNNSTLEELYYKIDLRMEDIVNGRVPRLRVSDRH